MADIQRDYLRHAGSKPYNKDEVFKMIYLAQRNQFLADRIVNENSDMMYAGIVSGNNAGTVWADDLSSPDFCIAWSDFLEGFHFMGSHNKINKTDLIEFIDNTAKRFLLEKNINSFEFSCDSNELHQIICEIFSNRCCQVFLSKKYLRT